MSFYAGMTITESKEELHGKITPVWRQTGNPTAKMGEASRSPKESPPTMKKKLCRLFEAALVSSSSGLYLENALNDSRFPHRGISRSGGSSVSQQRSRTLARSFPVPILKKTRHSGPKKGVSFSSNVTVLQLGEDGELLCSSCESLREEQATPSSAYYRQRRSFTPYATSTNIQMSHSPPSPTFVATDKHRPNDLSKHKLNPSSINFRFYEDHAKGTMLKFVIPVGQGFSPDDIIVKANVSGSRVRLVANKRTSDVSNADVVCVQEFCERYDLPLEVDPYQVTARLDIRGNLTVQAPLKSQIAKRTATVPSQPILQSIPL